MIAALAGIGRLGHGVERSRFRVKEKLLGKDGTTHGVIPLLFLLARQVFQRRIDLVEIALLQTMWVGTKDRDHFVDLG